LSQKTGRFSHFFAKGITQERNMLIAERFLSGAVRDYGKHPVSTDGGTWYPMACQFLGLDHHVHSPLEKSLIERKNNAIYQGQN
jgi:transposase-like protein